MADAGKLADMLARDMLREQPEPYRAEVTTCHLCGYSHTYHGPNGDVSGRFCSDRCRELYDSNRFPAFEPYNRHDQRWYSLPVLPGGFQIDCGGCGKPFRSRGLRCCSPKCESAYRQRGEVEKLKAEAGIVFESKLGAKRKCGRDGCPNDIPRWRNGRLVSKATRFCSPKCKQIAKRAV
jgi:hypothetical protein